MTGLAPGDAATPVGIRHDRQPAQTAIERYQVAGAAGRHPERLAAVVVERGEAEIVLKSEL